MSSSQDAHWNGNILADQAEEMRKKRKCRTSEIVDMQTEGSEEVKELGYETRGVLFLEQHGVGNK